MNRIFKIAGLICMVLLHRTGLWAQGDVMAIARMDTKQIVVGDQARLFLVAENNPKTSRLEWPVIPDSVNGLEIVEKGKIDTELKGDVYTYRQRLMVTGFDSGIFTIPSFQFTIIPNNKAPFTIQTDSFQLMVQTVQVDTTKAFKPIKNIVYVKGSWLDYWPYYAGGLFFIALIAFVILYFIRNKKVPVLKPTGPKETVNEKAIRLLSELDAKQLWQKEQVKEYYIELSDIVRNYIEERFRTPALELTTDELLSKAKVHRDLQPYTEQLKMILQTADLAKFAKAQPLPQEHFDAMENARKFIEMSRPVVIVEPQNNKTA